MPEIEATYIETALREGPYGAKNLAEPVMIGTAPAIANLGVQPTFGKGAPRRLEVHVPGWTRDLYDETIEVRLVRRIRAEKRFEDEAALKAQIKNDLAELQRSVADGEI